MLTWREAMHQCDGDNTPHVVATIVETTGSTPRKTGGKMVVTANHIYDTLGGGQLEMLVIETARRMLEVSADAQKMEKYPLAAAAMQCCGGSVTVLYESFGMSRLNVTVFGAGHIGSRICKLLSDLPAYTTIVDSRPDQLRDVAAERIFEDEPLSACERIPAGEIVLVMTHDHLIDYQIISKLILRTDLAMLGLIGSATKWQNFRRRLSRDGMSDETIDRVTSPIGLAEVPGKTPMAVAISVVAQLLQTFDPENVVETPVREKSHDAG